MDMKKHPLLRKAIYILIWLLLWQALSLLVHNDILLVGPPDAAFALIRLAQSPIFAESILSSLFRITGGICLGSLLGLSAALFSAQSRYIRDFLLPFVSMIKAVPVAAFVILLLIWFSSDLIALIISLLVTFPILYINSLQALDALDPKMQEMAAAFRIPRLSRLRYIILPECLPALLSAFSLAIGMGIKSGVAAEVIGQSACSLGNALYRSKIYLETGQVLAWTAVIVLLSRLLEKGWLALLQRAILPRRNRRRDRLQAASNGALNSGTRAKEADHPKHLPISSLLPRPDLAPLKLRDVRVGYEDLTILPHFSYSFLPGRTYVLTGPSGSGKTSLLMCIQKKAGKAGLVFQENRLCMAFSAEDNIRLIDPGRLSRNQADLLLAPLFAGEDFKPYLPVSEYSGGMQRRVAIARACASDAPILLFDEPLTGLDEKNIDRALAYIKRMRAGRPLIFTAHRADRLRAYFPDLEEIPVSS